MLFVRVARLSEELKIAHGAGRFTRLLLRLTKMDVLLLDDWGLPNVDQSARNDLPVVLDDLVDAQSTIFISQFPLNTGMPCCKTRRPPTR